jgi:hypothetical protein
LLQKLAHDIHPRFSVEQRENGAAIEPAYGLLSHGLRAVA